jgi:hypothetical protein
MRHSPSTRTIGRTVVVGTWLAVLAVAAESAGLAVLLGTALTLVWASPYLLVTNRHPRAARPAAPPRPVVGPRPAGPVR